MFEFLHDEPADRVLGAAYFAARLITHRASIGNYLEASPVTGVSTEPSPAEAELGRRIIRHILDHERTDMDGLSPDAASKYLSELLHLVHTHLRAKGDQSTAERSRRILAKWRSASHSIGAR